jgi:hemerythrin-like metal-binding protein
MAQQTAQQSSASSKLASDINLFASNGSTIMNELRDSIESINALNVEIQNIQQMFQMVTEKTRVIDEIVFNTKLLSFNASIEAERAGTHGAGFAVVAQEIGKLANNSGVAAKDIREILKDSNSKVGSIVTTTAEKVSNGRKVAEKVIDNFSNIITKIADISQKIEAIKNATKEQEVGIQQISKAITNMDLSAQENVKVAHNTELLSAKSEDQLKELQQILETVSEQFDIEHSIQANSNDLIKWNSSFELGIQSIDEQHIQLVDIINNLYRSIKNNDSLSKLDDIFKSLIEYTEKHFSYEEIMFSESDYPTAADHKQLHKKFVKQVEDLKNKFKSGNGVMTRDVMDFLKDWLIEHIQKTDFKYAPYVKKQGVN